MPPKRKYHNPILGCVIEQPQNDRNPTEYIETPQRTDILFDLKRKIVCFEKENLLKYIPNQTALKRFLRINVPKRHYGVATV
jgi:hypothetical protein